MSSIIRMIGAQYSGMPLTTSRSTSSYLTRLKGLTKVITRLDESLDGVGRKIERTRNHMIHLSQRLPSGKAHGGKRFRVRRSSIQAQITLASRRLKVLQSERLTLWQEQAFTAGLIIPPLQSLPFIPAASRVTMAASIVTIVAYTALRPPKSKSKSWSGVEEVD